MTKKMWIAEGVLLIFLYGAVCCGLGALVAITSLREAPPTNDPDEATFMLECTYGWGQTPDNCRKILQGEDPMPLPTYNEGC